MRNAVHDAAAAARFPGPDYYQVLGWLHQELQPAGYVEIGVSYGESLKLAAPPTIALGIDPAPLAEHRWKTTTRLVALPSSKFFQTCDLRDQLGMDHFSLAFIDGRHLFEQVLEDLFHLERYTAHDSLVAVHDTIPLDRETASRRRTTTFHTGDVWKIVPFLKRHRKHLHMITVRTAPSGLTLIRRLDPLRADAIWAAQVPEFVRLPWDYYERRHEEFLETIPNERPAVTRWLRGSAR